MKKFAKYEVVSDLANYLIDRYDFRPEDAIKISEEFWKKNDKKLSELIG